MPAPQQMRMVSSGVHQQFLTQTMQTAIPGQLQISYIAPLHENAKCIPGLGCCGNMCCWVRDPPPPARFDRERASRAEGAARSRRDRARCPSRRGDRACRLEILKRAAPRPSCHRITAVSDATRVVDSKTFLFSRTRADLPPTLTALRSPTSSRARTSWSRRTSSRPTTRARRAASAAGATAASTTTFRRCTSTSSTTTGSE